MFQKTIVIYLALLLGIGIDPCCCFRAWIADNAVVSLLRPLGLVPSSGNQTNGGEADEADGLGNASSCCAAKKVIQPKRKCCQSTPIGRDAPSQSSSHDACNTQSDLAKKCKFDTCDQCGCDSNGLIDQFVASEKSFEPITYVAWPGFSVDVVLADPVLIDWQSQISSSDRLDSLGQSLYCRWIC